MAKYQIGLHSPGNDRTTTACEKVRIEPSLLDSEVVLDIGEQRGIPAACYIN